MSVAPMSENVGHTILIIDDRPANLAVVVSSLEQQNYRVAVARDGEEGLKRAQFILPDLVLLDVVIPGMNGFETCRRLKASESTKDIPVVFMTALTETEHKVAGFDAGAVDYVTKPFQIEELLARVNTHLSLRAMRNKLESQNMELQQEILERRRIEEALARQSAFFRHVIDINPHLIFAKDREGRFTLVNQALADAFRDKVDDLIGKTDADINPNVNETEMFRRDDLEVLNTRREKVVPEEKFTDANGQVHWLQTVKRPILDVDGNAYQVLGVATDITALKRTEAELNDYKKKFEERVAERLEVYSYSLSQRLQEPFHTIHRFVQALRDSEHERLSDEGRAILDRIKDSMIGVEQFVDERQKPSS